MNLTDELKQLEEDASAVLARVVAIARDNAETFTPMESTMALQASAWLEDAAKGIRATERQRRWNTEPGTVITRKVR